MQDYYGLEMINHANIGLEGWKPVNNNNIPLHVEITQTKQYEPHKKIGPDKSC